MSDGAPTKIELSVPRATRYLSLVRRVVASTATGAGFPDHEVDKIELAIDEACSNAVLHGGELAPSVLRVAVDVTEAALVVVLRDGGPPYPFDERGNFALSDQLGSHERGGLGIYIIKTFMDEVTYEHSDERGSVLTMSKALPEG